MPWIEQRQRAADVVYIVRTMVEGKRANLARFTRREDAEQARAEMVGAQRAKDIRERLLTRSERVDSGCLLWTGRTDKDGYGRITHGVTAGGFPRPALVHRLAYETFVGPLDPSLTIDHTCHNAALDCSDGRDCWHRRCIEPTHLEQVSAMENTLRRMKRAEAAA